MRKTLLNIALLSSLNCAAADDSLEHIIVIAPMHSPLTINTDPKLPRQPLPAQDGADLLSSITGFSMIKKGAASSDPVFRGMAGSRLNIITDGGLTLGGCGSRMDPPTAYITPQTYDKVKVIKGPQTVIYGSGNSAATVVFERESERMLDTQVTGFVNVVASNAHRRGLSSDIKLGTADYFVRFAGSYNRADDYEDGDGTPVHSHYKRWNNDIELAYTPADDKTISLTFGRSDGEVAYADRMMDGSLFDRTHAAISTDWALELPYINRVEAQWYYNYVDHIMDNYSLRRFKPNMMMKNPTASNPDRRSSGAKVLLNAQVNSNNDLVFGVDMQQDKHRNRSSRDQFNNPVTNMTRVSDAIFNKVGVFAEHTYTLSSNQQIISGLRLDNWRVSDERQSITVMKNTIANPTASLTRKDSLWSGFSRFVIQQDKAQYYVGLGHAERFPDYWELMGANRAAPNNPSAFLTDTEKTDQLDLGMLYKSPKWQANISLFYNRINDFILIDNQFEQNSMNRNVTRNIDAQTIGFEAEASYQLNENWQASSSASYVRANNLTDHTPLAQQPPMQMRFSFNYERDNWQAGLLWTVAAAQHRISLGQGSIAGQDVGPTSGFGTLSLNARYRLASGLDWSAGVDNLFDKTYAQHLSKSGAAVSGYQQIDKVNEPGMTIWSNINWRF
ncbi:TonB-dependent copper receptor [Pseudoalteromonas sp. JBTF-M23]|uniref:TonB-dependent copper receptor n=1 Tax=Pseudoalteromonas caenipelagi TaxID=2726988 RepID=A0A849V9U6_9GAMM|nr:TonB-dependent copper receptor [Pseudoalteromonas caenipelagi]NOU49658.1 TonB-dependent copper receptor [Pseudoalteromonas caenipelagi]